MRRVWPIALTALVLMAPHATRTQTGDDEAAKNARQARAALEAMLHALGGDLWLNIQNQYREGHIAAFSHGDPDPGTTDYYEFHQWPDHDRIEYTKHRDVVQFYLGRQGFEVTYRGKKPLDKDIVDDYLRRRDHSIEMAMRVWLKDPNTILLYEGEHMSERHLAVQVTLISPQNESITILMDEQTHLPLARSFEWRDPLYHDKNTDTEEYDDYHLMDGFQTPFTVTRIKNGDTVRQFYLSHVTYNQNLPADFWDPDAEARKVKK